MKILEWIKGQNTNRLLIIGLVVFILLYLQQCNRSSNLKDDLYIANNNAIALSDSIKVSEDKNGTLVYEKGILIASKKELKELNKELYDEVKDLKNNPKIIIREHIRIIHDTVEVPTYITKYPDGSQGLNWAYDTTYSEGNYQKLAGESRFFLDTTGNAIKPITTLNTNEFGISLITGLDKTKEGNYEIFVKSDYPGFVVTNLQGSVIDKKMLLSNESSWVVGPQIGYGVTFVSGGQVHHGITLGVGVTYNLNKSIKKLFKR